MLRNCFTSFKFVRFFQSGMYFDFFYKKLSEVFVRNVFIYGAQFFAEKFMIEYFTKKLVDSVIFNNNSFISWTTLSYSWFFLQITSIVMYSLSLLNLIIILL